MFAERNLRGVFDDSKKVQHLTIDIKSRKFKPQVKSLKTTGQFSICDKGMECVADTCLPCSKGTYLNAKTSKCEACEKNMYNPLEQQEKCLECPIGFHQPKEGSPYCKVCPKNFFGKNCRNKCKCMHGVCDFMYGSCSCSAGWTGRYCEKPIESCKKDSCPPGVKCISAAPPEVGFTCGSCPRGFNGDGYTCTKRTRKH